MESETEHRKVPKENAAVETGMAPIKRDIDRHLTAGRRGKQKELTRGDCGSRRKLSAAYRRYPAVQEWNAQEEYRHE
jgi:hypothetical protein